MKSSKLQTRNLAQSKCFPKSYPHSSSENHNWCFFNDLEARILTSSQNLIGVRPVVSFCSLAASQHSTKGLRTHTQKQAELKHDKEDVH